jgi:hypothetical protein
VVISKRVIFNCTAGPSSYVPQSVPCSIPQHRSDSLFLRSELVGRRRNLYLHPSPRILMGPSSVSTIFRLALLTRQCGLVPLAAPPKPVPITILPLSPLSRHSFSNGIRLQNSQESRYSGSDAQTGRSHTKAHCLCHQQRRVADTEQDRGASRSSLLDAALTAFMGIGIGESSFQAVCLALRHRYSTVRMTSSHW